MDGAEELHLEKLKQRNTETIRQWGLDVNEHLPWIDFAGEVSPPDAKSVASRACALSYVVGVAFGADRADLLNDLKRFSLWSSVSRKEQRILQEGPSEQEEIDCGWLVEAIQALAWCLGLVDLEPTRESDDDLTRYFPLGVDPNAFISQSQLRPFQEIQEKADLYYRLHWYVRQCQLKGKKPDRVIASVVVEHRRALDWVYGVEEDWDEVPGDT